MGDQDKVTGRLSRWSLLWGFAWSKEEPMSGGLSGKFSCSSLSCSPGGLLYPSVHLPLWVILSPPVHSNSTLNEPASLLTALAWSCQREV